MDKLSRQTFRLKERPDVAALDAAEAVQSDFEDLVAMFDRQLAGLPADNSQARSHLAKAKAAVERGLQLSGKLIGTLGR